MVAALLFLVPATTLVGGYALLAIFALAIVIHGLHGELGGLEILVLYGVAVFVSMAERKDRVGAGNEKLLTAEDAKKSREER
jgi:hypothetical protein